MTIIGPGQRPPTGKIIASGRTLADFDKFLDSAEGDALVGKLLAKLQADEEES